MNISHTRRFLIVTLILTMGCTGDTGGQPQNGVSPENQIQVIRPTTPITTAGGNGNTGTPQTRKGPQSPDTFVLIPECITLAAGGSPTALFNSRNKFAPAFLAQFGPIAGILQRAGTTLEGVESFWVGSNSARTEQLLCLTLKEIVSLAALEEHLQIGETIGNGPARIYGIPGGGENQYGVSIVHTRGLLLGRLSTLEQALANPEPGPVRQALQSLDFLDADFWIAGDRDATGEQLQAGLPGIGNIEQGRLTLVRGFGLGLQLEQPVGDPGTGNETTSNVRPGTMMESSGSASSVSNGSPEGVIVVFALVMEQEPQAQALKPVMERMFARTAEELNTPPETPMQSVEGVLVPEEPTDPPNNVDAPPSEPSATQEPLPSVPVFRSPGLRPVEVATESTEAATNGTSVPWVRQNATTLRAAYRFDDWDGEVRILGDLLRAAGSSPMGDALYASPLNQLYDGYQQWNSQKPGILSGLSHVGDGHVVGGYSWMTELLPYVGHETLYFRFNFEKSWSAPENLPWASQVIPAFLNPADPRVEWEGYPLNGMGLSHFAGMSGVEDRRNVVAASLPRTDPRAGMFGYDAIATPSEVTDGLSSTIMLIGSGRLAAPWVQGGGATIRGAREPYFDSLSGFGSVGIPGGGTIVMLADGSTRTLSPNMDPSVFRALCTIHGAEQVDLPATTPPAGNSAGKLRVILTAAGEQKIEIIKIIREATGLSLRESLDLVEKAPQPVKSDLTQAEAEKLKAAIEAAGGTAQIESIE